MHGVFLLADIRAWCLHSHSGYSCSSVSAALTSSCLSQLLRWLKFLQHWWLTTLAVCGPNDCLGNSVCTPPPPKLSFTVEMCEVVPIASLKSCGCGRCKLTAWRWEFFQIGNWCPRQKVNLYWLYSQMSSSQVERRASPHKMAGRINGTQHYLRNIGPCVSFSFNSC